MQRNYVHKFVVYVDYDDILDALNHTPLVASTRGRQEHQDGRQNDNLDVLSSWHKRELFWQLRQLTQIVEDVGIDLVFRSISTESTLHPYSVARKSAVEHNDRVKVRTFILLISLALRHQ